MPYYAGAVYAVDTRSGGCYDLVEPEATWIVRLLFYALFLLAYIALGIVCAFKLRLLGKAGGHALRGALFLATLLLSIL